MMDDAEIGCVAVTMMLTLVRVDSLWISYVRSFDILREHGESRHPS